MSRASVLAMEAERVFFDSCAEAVVSRSVSKRHITSRRSGGSNDLRHAGGLSAACFLQPPLYGICKLGEALEAL